MGQVPAGLGVGAEVGEGFHGGDAREFLGQVIYEEALVVGTTISRRKCGLKFQTWVGLGFKKNALLRKKSRHTAGDLGKMPVPLTL